MQIVLEMLEINILLVEVLLILIIFIIIFIYSVFSAEMLTSLISLLIFLILLIPFYTLLERLEILVYTNNLENVAFFKFIFFYSTLIIVFIGSFIVIESVYLFGIS